MTLMSRIVAERLEREREWSAEQVAARDAELERIVAARSALLGPVKNEFHIELVESVYTADRRGFQSVGWRVWPVGWRREDAFRLVYEHPDVWYLIEKQGAHWGEFVRLYGPDGWEGKDVRDFLFRRYEAWRAAHPEEAAELEAKKSPHLVTIVAPLHRPLAAEPLHLAIRLVEGGLDDLVALASHLERNRPPTGEYLRHRCTKVSVDAPEAIVWVVDWSPWRPEIDDIPEYGMLLREDGDWRPRPPRDSRSEDRLSMSFEVRDDGMLTVEDEDGNWATIDLYQLAADAAEARAS